jgi:peptidoglycan hydrolase CwlO-like protein
VGMLLFGGVLGYLIGKNVTESEIQKKYDQQVQELTEEVEDAKQGISGDVEQGQAAIAEGQQTLESLQAENTTLKSTIDKQAQKIAELEQQLEEAQGSSTPTNQ